MLQNVEVSNLFRLSRILLQLEKKIQLEGGHKEAAWSGEFPWCLSRLCNGAFNKRPIIRLSPISTAKYNDSSLLHYQIGFQENAFDLRNS
ncbi:hypothetical protein K1719_037506 [Acacia pycnantha]|nr:hypothetical protein K1719_037506 [Acacia pycnantha]